MSEQQAQNENSGGGLRGSIIKVDSSVEGLRKAALQMFKALEGRDPTPEEMEKLDAVAGSIAEGKEVSYDPIPVNPDAVVGSK